MVENLELVIFDLGGTTIRDSGQVPQALTAALGSSGIDVSVDDLQQARGASKREVIRRFVEHHYSPGDPDIVLQTDQIFNAFCNNLAERYSHQGIEVLPGVNETFDWLHKRHVKIAINTGFDRMITDLIIESVDWGPGIIQAVVCGDDVTQGRPAPFLIFHAMESLGVKDVHQVAVVGDTVLDLQAGWNAGVRWNIGVWSGAHPREKLKKAPHTLLLQGVGELPLAFS